MNREHRTILNSIFDEALANHSDLPTASRCAQDEIERLEADGQVWAREYLDAATRSGLSARLRSRSKSVRVCVAGTSMPSTYANRSWLDQPVAELDPVIRSMEAQSDVMAMRAGVMRLGQLLASKYGLATAAEAFAEDERRMAQAVAS